MGADALSPAVQALRVAVIGAGWAGLAAAIEATESGHAVSLFDMAAQPGGRARQVAGQAALDTARAEGEPTNRRGTPGTTDRAPGLDDALDNGQHILIGAYTSTLALMRRVGVDPDDVLLRCPLCLAYPDGNGLVLKPGPAVLAFARAVLGQRRWHLGERLALLRAAVGWRLRGFRCPTDMTVAALTRSLPASLREAVIDPLCVAALNTPSAEASAMVFLRVLRDALFSGPGAADLLLPRRRLSALLPTPAVAWLEAAGASLQLGHRVQSLTREADGPGTASVWRVDGQTFDRVVLATTSSEAARLTADIAADWSALAAAMRHEPIISLTLHSPGTRLALPMLALQADDDHRPAQFVFDQGQLDGPAGRLTLVISGAATWVARGKDATVNAAIAQLRKQLGPQLKSEPSLVKMLTDKRATFRCTPGLKRPPMRVAAGLFAAGDHVAGPYPATLEGAVRSGLAAARALSSPHPPSASPCSTGQSRM